LPAAATSPPIGIKIVGSSTLAAMLAMTPVVPAAATVRRFSSSRSIRAFSMFEKR
jgi:hypothetical protein